MDTMAIACDIVFMQSHSHVWCHGVGKATHTSLVEDQHRRVLLASFPCQVVWAPGNEAKESVKVRLNTPKLGWGVHVHVVTRNYFCRLITCTFIFSKQKSDLLSSYMYMYMQFSYSTFMVD